MSNITVHTNDDGINTTLTINFSNIDLPDWLERELSKRELNDTPEQSYMIARRELVLLTRCDTDNPYNPSKYIIDANKKLADDIIDNLETTPFNGYRK